ncbi:MAG: GNAT family N-acetyltransferase [Myxococcales bacterium]|nr:GNAT family N-acetyltransferase [Myxococcales bacterium]MCB9712689.1 GNAT family N-acetyltransferase [Myxococcales bacterium]
MPASRIDAASLESVASGEWNEFVTRNASCPHSQSVAFAEYVKECRGWRPTFLTAEADGGVARLLVFDDARRSSRTWTFGPVHQGPSASQPACMRLIAHWVLRDGHAVRRASTAPVDESHAAAGAFELSAVLAEREVAANLAGTLHIVLDDHLWTRASWRSSGKRRTVESVVRRCEQRGVTVQTSLEHDLRRSYERMLVESFQRNTVTDQDAAAATQIMASQDRQRKSVSFLAERRGEALAAINVAFTGTEAYLRKLVYSERCRELRLGATDLVIMRALEWSRRHGMGVFHFPLVRLASDRKTRDLRRFKLRFGGVFRPIVEYSTIPRS